MISKVGFPNTCLPYEILTHPDILFPFVAQKTIFDSTSLVAVDGFGKQLVNLECGGKYQVGVRVTNNVDFTSEYWTSGVKIDTTAPIFRRVISSYNVHSDAIRVSWELFDDESGIKLGRALFYVGFRGGETD